MMITNHRFRLLPGLDLWLLALLLTVLTAGCSSAYYGALESLGVHKRDVLVSRIEKARDSQEDAKQQFASALEQFKATVDFDGGDLEQMYNRLNAEFEASESRAEQVTGRINDVESVAEALFEEWEQELEQISSTSLQNRSRQQMNTTRQRYNRLVQAMRRAESRIEPVLVTFRDQVLFLKHNLNARAVASLGSELNGIESDVDSLVQEMEKAINEATQFISQMQNAS